MINPGTYNIICPQGATFDRTFTLTIDGTPQNLTSYTAAMQVRESVNATSTLVNLTTENGGITLGGSSGTITVTISAISSANFLPGIYLYDLELYSQSTTTRLLQGSFTVTGEITHG
jgi:hypothetical protein